MYGAGHMESADMHIRPSDLESEKVIADLFLGVTVTGLYTLVAMGLIIAFM
jgi:hypothetical protein